VRVLLVSANREEVNMLTLPLGLACVAEATRSAGHEVEMIDLIGRDDADLGIGRAIDSIRPEVIGISIRNIDDQNMDGTRFLLDIAGRIVSLCRAATDAPIVLGGAGYSIFPESALAYLGADMGIRGEGEQAFPALLERLSKNRPLSDLPGLYRPGIAPPTEWRPEPQLERLPWPKPSCWPQAQRSNPQLWIPVQIRRGCPLGCVYCSTASIEGRRIRTCAPDKAAERMDELVRAGFSRFFFTDNIFNLPPSYAKAFCRALKERGLKPKWLCIVYPTRLDEELVRLMAEAGCAGVSLGFETGSARMLAGLNKRFSLSDVRRAASMLAEHGLPTMGFLLLGGPGETRESVLESLDFAESLPITSLKLTVGLRIYPETPLAAIAARRGLIPQGDDLLRPRFYLEPGLEDWLRETVQDRARGRANWMTGA